MDKYLYHQLTARNCIKKGCFKLKNGQESEFYVDIKSVISYPYLVKYIGDQLYQILEEFDVICGIPYGALPIAAYISTTYNKPLIYVRDKIKEYGTQKLIEGNYNKEDRCAIIDDVLTTGNSLEKEFNTLSTELNIVDTAVVVNRSNNYQVKSLIKI